MIRRILLVTAAAGPRRLRQLRPQEDRPRRRHRQRHHHHRRRVQGPPRRAVALHPGPLRHAGAQEGVPRQPDPLRGAGQGGRAAGARQGPRGAADAPQDHGAEAGAEDPSHDPGGAKELPEAELQKYYDEHKDEFHRPKKVARSPPSSSTPRPARPSAPRRWPPAKKAAGRGEGRREEEPAWPSQPRSASSPRTPPPRRVAGDLGFKSAEELEKSYGKELAEAAFALKAGRDLRRRSRRPRAST